MAHHTNCFTATDRGGHEVFTQITVPPAPAPVVAIERRGEGCYIAHTPRGTILHADFRSALKAIYPGSDL